MVASKVEGLGVPLAVTASDPQKCVHVTLELPIAGAAC